MEIEKYLKCLTESITPTNKPYDVRNIEKETIKNDYFRQVLFTAKNLQLVVMSLNPNEEIGEEIHDDTDQFFRIDQGEGLVVADGKEIKISDGDSVIIPQGTKHNIINTSNSKKLKLYTIYSPPHHKDKTIHKTKAEAEKE
jgi:mannose-6-phosphate isomerase-like protein (cupin superfamily)